MSTEITYMNQVDHLRRKQGWWKESGEWQHIEIFDKKRGVRMRMANFNYNIDRHGFYVSDELEGEQITYERSGC